MTTEKNTAPSPENREQAADLAKLATAAEAENDPLENPAADTAAAVVDTAAIIAEIPEAVGDILSMFMPEMSQVYTKEACRKFGDKWARVAEVRGWDVEGNVGPGLGAALATFPLLTGTFLVIKAYRARNAAIEGQARREEGGQAPVSEPGRTEGAVSENSVTGNLPV